MSVAINRRVGLAAVAAVFVVMTGSCSGSPAVHVAVPTLIPCPSYPNLGAAQQHTAIPLLVPNAPEANQADISGIRVCGGTQPPDTQIIFSTGVSLETSQASLAHRVQAWRALSAAHPDENSMGTVGRAVALFIRPLGNGLQRTSGEVVFVHGGLWTIMGGNGILSDTRLSAIAATLRAPSP